MSEPSSFWTYFPLLPLRLRNTALDAVFYDVGSLTALEMTQLLFLNAQKGSVIVVSPTQAKNPIRYYQRALRFIAREGDRIRAISVAGVGSSVIGAAALARNVADALDEEVAAIVTGYGVADVLNEALGGAFVYGLSDAIRRASEDMLQWLVKPMSKTPPLRGELTIPSDLLDPSSPGFGLPGDEDTTTLADILLSHPKKLDLLVGHSKGSLIIDAALEDYVSGMEGDASPLYHRLKVVTLGAVSDIPDRFPVAQYLGGLDWFGGLNSRPDLLRTNLPGALHHLNRQLPYHVDAIEVLRAFRSARGATTHDAIPSHRGANI